LTLAICVVVSVPAYTAAAPTPDPTAANIYEVGAFYDNRTYDTWTSSAGGPEAKSGAYLQLYVGVELTGLLDNYNRVVSVTAAHQETGLTFDLLGDDPCTSFVGAPEKIWTLYVRPSSFIMTGTWNFTLLYRANDGTGRHQQVVTYTMGQTNFPPKPSNIQVTADASGDFIVSWSGFGNPLNGNMRYFIRAYDAQGACAVYEYRGPGGLCTSYYPDCEVGGSYNTTTNRISFTIPAAYSGHVLRLENRINVASQTSRSAQYMRLP
jgi:hypothetical protein